MENIYPLVSVIIPFFSNRSWLEKALESVFSQTYPSIEIIIVDDGSTEDISNIADNYTNVSLYRIENSGAGTARNLGIEKSRGEYVAFLDSDDLWFPSKLEKQILYMQSDNLMCSHTDYIRFWDGSNKKEYVSANIKGNILPKCLVWNPIATPCVVINSKVFENSLLRFRKGKTAGEDGYLWRLIAEQYVWGYMNEPLSSVRMRGTNAAFDMYKQLESRTSFIEQIKKYRRTFKSKIVYLYAYAIFLYCDCAFTIVKKIFPNAGNKRKIVNFVSGLFYAFPYANFHVIKRLL